MKSMVFSFPCMVIILALPFLGASQDLDSNFSIRDFRTERVYDQSANPVWEPDKNATAGVALQNFDSTHFTLRRKFAYREYSLFQGQMLPGAYNNLFAFKLESGKAKDHTKIKFYFRQEDDWFHDIDDIYFLEDLVLAGPSIIYFKEKGQWQELKALPRKPMRLVLQSNPPGAKVLIDGKNVGVTPLTALGLVEPHVNIRMTLPGYYPQEEPVGFEQTAEATVSWTLNRLLPADAARSQDSLPLGDLSKADAPSLEAYEARQERIRTAAEKVGRKRDSTLAMFEKLYPPLKAREEFETSPDFKSRRSAYQAAKDSQQTALTAHYNRTLNALKEADQRIEDNKEPMEKVILQTELGGSVLELSRYDVDNEAYPFKLKINLPTLWFHYAGKFSVPAEIAKRLKANPDSAHFSIRYWNLRLYVDSARSVFPALDSIRCTFAGQTLRVKDAAITFPPGITDLAGYSRIQKRMQSFVLDRADAVKQRDQDKLAHAALAKKAKWRKIRLYSGLGLTAISLGAGIKSYLEKKKADEYYTNYRGALSTKQAQEDRHAAGVHDKNFLQWAISGGVGISVGVAVSLF